MSQPRFYYESDGGGLGKTGNRTHYVIDRYANPLSDNRRTDCDSRRKLAREYNESPPWPAWDDIQATRDGYAGPIEEPIT